MMGLLPCSPQDVKALRDEMGLYGMKLSPEQAIKVLRHIGNRHIAVEALLLSKRPKWLEELVGPRAVRKK